MRVYDVAVASLAIGVEKKWLDNLTSQHSLPGTDHFARGVPRRLSMRALVTAALVRQLNRELGVPVARAVDLAAAIILVDLPPVAVAGAGAGVGIGEPLVAVGLQSLRTVNVTAVISLTVDLHGLERDIERRLLEAMETAVPRRRGRPPAKERRGTQ